MDRADSDLEGIQVMYRKFLTLVPSLMGMVFLWAAGYKLLFPGEATMALESLGVDYKYATALVVGGIIIELYVGTLLILKIDLKYATIFSIGLMFFFTAYLWYLSTLAHPPSCGCLGLTGIFKSSKHAAIFGVVRNCMMLWAMLLAYNHHFQSAAESAVDPGSRPKSLF